MIARKKRLMMQKSGLDTSPKVAQYGVYWGRTFGQTVQKEEWCITEWYDIDDEPGNSRDTYINGYVGKDTSDTTFQFYNTNSSSGWYYFNGTNPRRVFRNTYRISQISFSIESSKLDDSYAFMVETGQIIFAGKNTIYYGHKNVSELN